MLFSRKWGVDVRKKRLWQLICRFFRTFCGAVLKLGLLSDIFFCFSIPSLTVGLVGNLLHAICVLCMFGRWAMSAVDYLGMVVGHWQWPISICCIYFFWREAINPPVTPDGYHWYDFTRVQLDDKKWGFFLTCLQGAGKGLLTGTRLKPKQLYHGKVLFHHRWQPHRSGIKESGLQLLLLAYCSTSQDHLQLEGWLTAGIPRKSSLKPPLWVSITPLPLS